VENGMMFNEPINFYTGYSNDVSLGDQNSGARQEANL